MKHTSCFQVRTGHSLVDMTWLRRLGWVHLHGWEMAQLFLWRSSNVFTSQERDASNSSVFSCAAVSLLTPAELTAV